MRQPTDWGRWSVWGLTCVLSTGLTFAAGRYLASPSSTTTILPGRDEVEIRLDEGATPPATPRVRSEMGNTTSQAFQRQLNGGSGTQSHPNPANEEHQAVAPPIATPPPPDQEQVTAARGEVIRNRNDVARRLAGISAWFQSRTGSSQLRHQIQDDIASATADLTEAERLLAAGRTDDAAESVRSADSAVRRLERERQNAFPK
jgi:hypothetical protein